MSRGTRTQQRSTGLLPQYESACSDAITSMPHSLIPRPSPRSTTALTALEAGGARIEEIDVPAWDILNEACLPIFMSQALAYHRRNLAERWDDYGSFTRQMIVSGLFYTAVDHVQAQRVRRFVASKVDAVLGTVDVIATPTAGAGAPPVDNLDFATALTLPVFTAPWNALGLPTISVPCGFTDDRLPVGLQLAGRRFDEVTVLRAADGFQTLTDWHKRRPPLALDEARQPRKSRANTSQSSTDMSSDSMSTRSSSP